MFIKNGNVFKYSRYILALTLTSTLVDSSLAVALANSENTIEEILVTGRKRDEQLRDVPLSVTAITEAQIERAGVNSIDSISMQTTNFQISNTQNPGSVFLNVRGVGQTRNSEAPIAVIVDGVPMTSPNQMNQEYFDIQQIEIFKGPQGTIWGRNASGGAINIVTRAPSNELEGKATIGIGNGPSYKATGSVGGAIVDDILLFRVAGSYENYDGILHGVTLNRDVDDYEDASARARLIYEGIENVKIDLRGSYGRLTGAGPYFVAMTDSDGRPLSGQENNFSYEIVEDELGRTKRTMWDLSAKIDVDIDAGTFTSISSYAKVKEFFNEDLDFTEASILGAEQDLHNRAFTQELRFTSNSDGPFRWLAGGSYLKSKRYLRTDILANLNNYLAYVGGSSLENLPEPPGSNAFLSPLSMSAANEHNEAFAFFVNASYDITDQITLETGLRYDQEDRKQINFVSGGISKARFDMLQPKATLSYKPNGDHMLYVSAGRGFRSGGFNQTSTFGLIFKPEKVTTYEAGWKGAFLDNVVSVEASLFYTDFKNKQEYILDASVAAQSIATFPKARVYGLELDMTVRVTDEVSVFGGVGLLDTAYKSQPEGFRPSDVGLPANFDFRGLQTALAAEWSYRFGIDLNKDIGNGWFAGGRLDINGWGDKAWEPGNQAMQAPVHLVNAQVTFGTDAFEVKVWAKNLFNERYYQEFASRTFSGLLTDFAFPSQLRRFGVTGTVRF